MLGILAVDFVLAITFNIGANAMRNVCLLIVLMSIASCERRMVEKQVTSRRLSEWKYSNLVSVNFQETAFDKALAELSKRSDVRVVGVSDREFVSVKCDNVPFWEAVSRLSISSQTSFVVNRKGEVEFGGVLNLGRPVCEKWQLVGPFLVGGTNEREGGKRYVGLRLTCLPNEGAYSRQCFYNVELSSKKNKKQQLARKDSTADVAFPSWIVPAGFRDESFDISGELFCELFANTRHFDIEYGKEKNDFSDYNKMSVVAIERNHDASEPFVVFSIDWESGLTVEGRRELSVIVDEINRAKNPENYEVEDVKLWRWLQSNSEKYRLLHLMNVSLFDDQGKEIAINGRYVDEFDIFRPTKLKIEFKKGRTPALMRITVCERIPTIGTFSLPVPKL